ncbi:glutathionylspermidine synthase family protein [Sulfurimonas aquatica]|uniref:glutathionylspermidine synthase family protein n=1 Tax=Sulfurimonas aquatica TaxID=2672570 RepID=UPI001F6150B9|nr:glutathionylspermidine synthase family protein [Sulfurimonas aquatica]
MAKIVNNLYQLEVNKAEEYYEAANELYDMYVEAVEHIIENDLFFDVGIPFNLVEVIKKSWESDVHWHIYGSFSFNENIELLGFNADSPSYLYEIALEQYETLKVNGIDEKKQFNEVYKKISENFKRLITLFDDTDKFESLYDGWSILFSSLSDNEDDEKAVQFLQQMAQEAGFNTGFEYLENTQFGENGISDSKDNEYEYWYKHYRWEEMSYNEPELLTTLTDIMNNQKAIILNPAYTAVFEAKGILKVLKKLYPDSEYLKDDVEPTEFQANVFFAYEACGMGFINESNEFIGHTLV